MDSEPLSYEKWVEEALRNVIKRALKKTALEGLQGDHHFFITFMTNRDDVDIPVHLRAEHPDEMTIVLQHQFHDLKVDDEGFSVTLSFSGRPCHLSIPYSAIIAFADPAVNFVLQLKMAGDVENYVADDAQPDPAAPVETFKAQAAVSKSDEDDNDDQASPEDDDKMGEVIALDTFRKK
ncbi:MAG: hypothetical protein H8D75_00090 [Rhodospirillaceae bacterium]|nr:hypothetical protein [Rhodospirillaceae bacterium]